ncbi:MAG TPA: SRPBCC family protein [Acidimicrobiales bacterium]|nr:SRPBCC family protein [Acidimicrobiales bacterium]
MTDPVEVRTSMAAPAEHIYDLVADLTRMGEWSPETTACTWVGADREPRPGARFRGTNRHGWRRWTTTCVVLVADRGRELSWEARMFGLPIARWRYELRPDSNGATTVIESAEDRRNSLFKALSPAVAGVSDRSAHNRATMAITLERLKAAAEAG